jgi:L-iditol 2-dehydrogenase
MKAAVWQGPRRVSIDDIAMPKISSDEVLVRVKACGICGSELHAYEGLSLRRTPPFVLGHEFTGIVEEVGKDVKTLRVDDRVIVNPMIHCGTCAGAFVQHISVPYDRCFQLPENVSFEEATLTEPLSVSLHVANIVPIQLSDTIAIIGSGIIGSLVIQLLNLRGSSDVAAIDISDTRLAFAKKIGAKIVINSQQTDPVDEIMKWTANFGVDVVFETVGIQQTVAQAMKMLDNCGKMILVGLLQRSAEVDIMNLTAKQLRLLGSFGYLDHEFKTAISLIADKRIDVKAMISHTLPLDRIAEGFEAMARSEAMKVIVIPD